VPVNVAAIPRELLEAELFGAVRGAFTGADRPRLGLVRAAQQGTLFLDEIGDLDLPLQAKLLRVLESGEVRPVGSTTFHSVARGWWPPHRDLRAIMEAGGFRADLYYPAGAGHRAGPPLRERIEDLPLFSAFSRRDRAPGRVAMPMGKLPKSRCSATTGLATCGAATRRRGLSW
jgi:sigma-54-dependent transcriptional regulator